MKRNLDLVRSILLAIEKCDNWEDHHDALEELARSTGESEDVIAHHCYIMDEAGLITAGDTTTRESGFFTALPQHVTWKGHEFMDLARSDTNWNKAKASVASGTLEVLRKVLTAMATEGAKATLIGLVT